MEFDNEKDRLEYERVNDATPLEETVLVEDDGSGSYNSMGSYRGSRKEAYPPICEQLDMIYHSGAGGDEFQDTIRAVKDAHPKP